MFRANICISSDVAKLHGLDEDSVFEVFYRAPNLCIRQLSEDEQEEIFEPDFDEECRGCPHYCKAQGRCLLDMNG